MLAKLRKDQENEEGFTLIELLVVVIIIGILAAIAIPAFLNQRERAYQAELTSSVRNAALEVEAEATKFNGVYPQTFTPDPALLDGGTITMTYTPSSATAPSNGFTLCGTTSKIDGPNNVTYLGGASGSGLQDYAEAAC